MKELKISVIFILFITLLGGVFYPLTVTGIGQVTFKNKSDGSIVKVNGKAVGSKLIAQEFKGDNYFHSRPSAINYNSDTSGGSNNGPSDEKLLSEIEENILKFKSQNEVTEEKLPPDAITSSGSGLDPHISLENAMIQVNRVAKSRGKDIEEIKKIVDEGVVNTISGNKFVNVLLLNIALDK